MNWLHYVACFFAGLFFGNTIPHLVKGVCGDRFPTPFAKPPGKGLSSPVVNVVWALANLLVAYALFRAGNLAVGNTPALAIFFAGFALISIQMGSHFSHKHAA